MFVHQKAWIMNGIIFSTYKSEKATDQIVSIVFLIYSGFLIDKVELHQ